MICNPFGIDDIQGFALMIYSPFGLMIYNPYGIDDIHTFGVMMLHFVQTERKKAVSVETAFFLF